MATAPGDEHGGAPAPLVEMVGITKTYPNGVTALRGVDLALRRGEVHALVGENGAGKSTLVKILFGLETASSGEVRLNGEPSVGHSPASAIAAGIGMVHQHFKLVPSLTVAENLVLGDEPLSRGVFDRRRARSATLMLTEKLGVDIDPDEHVGNLPVGDQQRIEIMKALHRGAQILILDEPTAVLTPQEADRLLETVSELAANGHGVVFISHKLREVMRSADTISILRDGQRVEQVARSAATIDGLARSMVGRDIAPVHREGAAVLGPERLVLKGVSSGGVGRGRVKKLDLSVCGGEIVGVAGIEGNGQDDLVDIIVGLRPHASGTIEIDGVDMAAAAPGERRRSGLRHIAADRIARGAVAQATIAENVVADRVRTTFSRRGTLDRAAIDAAGSTAIEELRIRADGPTTPVWTLSGGNMQKVVVARELHGTCSVAVAAHPTRGVDLGAMALIHEQILRQRADGAAVLLISSELDELRQLSDRIVVMSEGQIVATFDDPPAALDEDLGRAMAGAAR